MTITNRAVPLLHRKEWQMMTPAPAAFANGSFVVHDVADLDNLALLVASATTHYLYHHDAAMKPRPDDGDDQEAEVIYTDSGAPQ